MPPTPLVIGLARGTGSGKTTVANVILHRVGPERIAYVPHGAYYRNLSNLPPPQRETINWGRPDSLESDLMIAQVQALKAWRAVELPVYDLTNHFRTADSFPIEPQPIIVVVGILIYADARLLQSFHMKVFVRTDAARRFVCRLRREIAERGRTAESVIRQYLATVRPMHLGFVEPTERYADISVPEGGRNEVAMEMSVARLEVQVAGASPAVTP